MVICFAVQSDMNQTHARRRRPNIEPTLGQRLEFAGNWLEHISVIVINERLKLVGITNKSTKQPNNQSNNQPNNQPTNQPNNQPSNQTTNQQTG